MNEKEKCFVITPIGNETDPIRRHIEGIIEAVIEPALGDEYEIVVSHKINSLGTITKQIIKEICEDKLVICNLTEKNPNVMYELALRHCTGKPVILIAEEGTSLPSDILLERTVFYRNDAKGTLELKKKLSEIAKTIKFGEESSPIHDVLREANIEAKFLRNTEESSNKEVNGDAIGYILQRLNGIEGILQNKIVTQVENNRFPNNRSRNALFTYIVKNINSDNMNQAGLFSHLEQKLLTASKMLHINNVFQAGEVIEIIVHMRRVIDSSRVEILLKEALIEFGYEEVEFIRSALLEME